MTGIYKITNPKGKVYIGQSVNIEKRFTYYKNYYCKRQPKLYRSILKYGVENHIFEIISYCDILELNELERYYQELYNVIEKGLNCSFVKTDSRSGKMSDSSKKLMSENHIKIWTGLNHSKETKNKISTSLKDKYKQGFKPNRNHIGSKNPMSRSVLNLNTGIFYDTIKEASFYMGFSKNSINSVLLGKIKNSKINVI